MKNVPLRSISAAVAYILSLSAHAATDTAKSLDIPRGELTVALQTLAQQTGTEFVYSSDQLKNVQTSGVHGTYTPETAVAKLLQGTPLHLTIHATGALLISDNIGTGSNTTLSALQTEGPPASGNGEASGSRLHLAQATQGKNPTNSSVSSSDDSTTLQEITVTAQRREQKLEEIPYSITAVGAEQLSNAGITDIASLSGQVPGLSMYDLGARNSSFVAPIIRGLNTDAPLNFRSFGQSPVGVYIGNSPLDGYFQLQDVQRVEVLRGPQGSLYGAGALGGALRIIPNAPVLGSLEGDAEVGGDYLTHADTPGYTAAGMINIPLGDTLAFRASAKYANEPGFINVYGILQRPGPILSAIPTLADPADPVNSPGIFSGKKDWNDQETFTGRASVLWKPVDKFNAQLAFNYSHLIGDGSRVVNPDFPGGAYPIDPRITFPSGGPNQVFSPIDQPYSRDTSLTSLDLSYDAGFATLSTTSSYATSSGRVVGDETYTYNAIGPAISGYYAGNPLNPRWVMPQEADDSAHTFTQEVRLVSPTDPDKLFDYVVGAFYEDQTRGGSQSLWNPGGAERSAAQGCTAPYYYGATFPNCQVLTGPNDITYLLLDNQRFRDVSEFGELTFHFLSHGNLTFGGRHSNQRFSDEQDYSDWAFQTFSPDRNQSSSTSKNTWKINPSYEYLPGQHVYALWSQGFRRGGSNALPTSGAFSEYPVLLSYRPDTVDNYETGLKGRFSNGFSYAFDVFDIEWHNPQIEGATPSTNNAVWNANKARSDGVEFDLNAPLPLPGLSISAGGAYTDARLTEDYLILADANGNLSGKAGQRLPGSPKISATTTLNYKHSLAGGYAVTLSLNDTYRSNVLVNMPFTSALLAAPAANQIPGMNILNTSAAVSRGSWRLGAYVTNLADKRAVQYPPQYPSATALDNDYLINQPREVSIRLGYSFGREP